MHKVCKGPQKTQLFLLSYTTYEITPDRQTIEKRRQAGRQTDRQADRQTDRDRDGITSEQNVAACKAHFGRRRQHPPILCLETGSVQRSTDSAQMPHY